MKSPLYKAVVGGLLVSAFAITLQACRSEKIAKPTVAIQSISPSNDAPILTGEKLVIEVSGLAYNVPEGARSSLIIQSASGEVLSATQPTSIKTGEKFKLATEVIVPPTASINANVAIYKDDQSNSIAVDWREFKVAGIIK